MTPFDWQDPFGLDAQLSEDERMIRDAAHAFAQSELQPRVIEAFANEADALLALVSQFKLGASPARIARAA